MNYLEQTITENKRFVDYIKGTLFFVFFHILGQIPLTLFIISQSNLTGEPINQNDIFSNMFIIL